MNGSSVGVSRFDLFKAVQSVAGQDAVASLKKLYGGTEVRVPTVARPGNWLCDLIGVEKAQQVIHILDVRDAAGPVGVEIYIPMAENGVFAKARARCEVLIAEGKSVAEIREETGLSERTVYKRLDDYRASIGAPVKLIGRLRPGDEDCANNLYKGCPIDPARVFDLSTASEQQLQSIIAGHHFARVKQTDSRTGAKRIGLMAITEIDVAIFLFRDLREVAHVLDVSLSRVKHRSSKLMDAGFHIGKRSDGRRKNLR